MRSFHWPTHGREWIGYVLFSVRRPYSTAPSCKSVDRESENCGYSSPGKNTGKSTSSIPLENHPQEKPLSQGKPMSQVKSSQETQLSRKPKTPTAYQRETHSLQSCSQPTPKNLRHFQKPITANGFVNTSATWSTVASCNIAPSSP